MMDLIQQLHTWSKGDILQGRWMIAIALVIFLPTCILLVKSNNDLQRGMVIPFCLLLVMNVGYGGYLLWSKPKHAEQTKKQFQLSPNEVLKYENVKISADDKSYSLTKYAWISLIAVSVAVYFIVTKDYYKGLALGLIGMFFGMLLIDTFLHQRLQQYHKFLQYHIDKVESRG